MRTGLFFFPFEAPAMNLGRVGLVGAAGLVALQSCYWSCAARSERQGSVFKRRTMMALENRDMTHDSIIQGFCIPLPVVRGGRLSVGKDFSVSTRQSELVSIY